MPNRTFSSSSYRYGFNSQEKDDEVAGEGNSNTAEYWQYDSRLGRRFNLDPKPNPSISYYACLENSPLLLVDPKGDTVKYERFRDRVNSLIGRLFSKRYRNQFDFMENNTDVYTLRKRPGNPSLTDGATLVGVNGSNKDALYGIVGSPVEVDTIRISVRWGSGMKEKHFKHFGKSDNVRSKTARNVVVGDPAHPIRVETRGYPDVVSISDPTTGTIFFWDALVSGMNNFAPNPSFPGMAIQPGPLILIPTSTTINFTVVSAMTWPRVAPNRPAADDHSYWKITYWKWKIVNFTMPIIKFK